MLVLGTPAVDRTKEEPHDHVQLLVQTAEPLRDFRVEPAHLGRDAVDVHRGRSGAVHGHAGVGGLEGAARCRQVREEERLLMLVDLVQMLMKEQQNPNTINQNSTPC